MYIPAHFRQADTTVLREFIEHHEFATLVTAGEGRPIASHLLFALGEEGTALTLKAHMARANRQWRGLSSDREVLVIFQGPQSAWLLRHVYVHSGHYEAHRP